MSTFLNTAFYHFAPWPEYRASRPILKQGCVELGLKGTILLAPEGVNGSVSGPEAAVRELIRRLREIPVFADLAVKETWSERQSFARMKVKLKRQIITMGIPADPLLRTGERLPPVDLCRWLDEGRDFLLVDTRNEYEVAEGTFAGALGLGLRTFHDFPGQLDAIEKKADGRPVVMFCTGGIRCEKATALALERGSKDIYQLDGGILNYFERCGDRHFQGGFVFDERVVLRPLARPAEAC